MLHLAVFGLPAVIRYHEPLLREYLLQAINKVEDSALSLEQLSPAPNAAQALRETYETHFNGPPGSKKQEKISHQFAKRVKKYFVDEDDSFEIRPGVQSIFDHIEKRKKFKYAIVSPYWAEATHLILQTCGVFSKNKLTITADDALSLPDQLKVVRKRAKKKDDQLHLYFLPGHTREVPGKYHELIQPPFEKGEHNFFAYPRFKKLFPAVVQES